MEFSYFNRDISWLSFNQRILMESAREEIPIGERLNFLSIYSSNSDEFYRVRIPALMGLHKIDKQQSPQNIIEQIETIIGEQQQQFGKILSDCIPQLKENHNINLVYGKKIPGELTDLAKDYFFNQVLAFLQPVFLSEKTDFFPENNRIYHVVVIRKNDKMRIALINIPSDSLSRFISVPLLQTNNIIFLDDIIRENIKYIFPGSTIESCNSIKITRDAELDLKDEYAKDLAEEIEEQLLKRDMGLATRFLYDENMPEPVLKSVISSLNLKKAIQIKGGRYHNLKDLSKLGLPRDSTLYYKKFIPIHPLVSESIFKKMEDSDFMLYPPYHSYETVLRFFNEAASDERVTDIYITLYRIAHDSHIAHALISAAKNGKKVTVFVELKARFDEANNIHWAKKMQDAGAKIIYSIPGLKVHAKIALVKRKRESRISYYGLLATGNFNENTASIYSDYVLFTTHKEILREMELLFIYFNRKREVPEEIHPKINFHHLLISKFNLLEKFITLIDEEINQAKKGLPASIILKLNNIEDITLINKLYEASSAGVKISLIIRGICRLVPGIQGMSQNIAIRRLVDRYLEHGRIFVFHHGGNELIFSGSADWMSRNMYRRIEVCFPVYNAQIKKDLKEILRLYLSDNTQAVVIDENLKNNFVPKGFPIVQAQQDIFKYINNHNK